MLGPADPLPLATMRVLDLADGRLQTVGRLLADLGADVVRVEPPSGSADRHTGVVDSGVSLTFAVRNANKRSVVVDPALGAGRLAELLDDTDLVLITPRTSPYDVGLIRSMRERNRRLVIVELTDFGQTGPMRDWIATPDVHAALSSVLSRSGLPELPRPLLPPPFLVYEAAAGQALWVAVLAYYQAQRTGVGDDVDFSVSEAIIQTLDPGMGIGGSARAGAPMRDLPRGRPDARYLYPIFPVSDGWVRICVLSPRQWQSMFEWLGRPAAFADPKYNVLGARYAAADTLYPVIAAMFAPLTRDEATEAGQALGVPIAGVASAAEVLSTEAFTVAGALRVVELPDGRAATVPTGWFEFDGVRSGHRSDAPPLGSAGDGAVFTPADLPPAAPPNREPGSPPFAGLRVLDLGVIVVGAELGRLLGDYGADVIKIESQAFPDGSRQSFDGSDLTEGFAWGHRNKRSLGLNLKSDEGKKIFRELVARSDVVLSNFKPGTLEGLGFGWDELVAINPRIILSESSAFGRSGPWSRRLGYGPLIRAGTGVSALWRYPEIEGSFSDAITIFPDHMVARLNAAAVAALLLRRERTGRGGRVSTAQVDAILGAMADLLAVESVRPGSIAAASLTPGDAPTGVFAADGDDEWVVVDTTDDEIFRRLAPAIGHAQWADDPALADAAGRHTRADELQAAVAEWTAGRSARDAAETLQAAGVPAGNMIRVIDFEADPHLLSRGFFSQLRQPQFAGPLSAMSNEALFTNLPAPRMTPAPLMAEHTVAIVREVLGLSEESIAALIDAGALELHQSRRPAPTAH